MPHGNDGSRSTIDREDPSIYPVAPNINLAIVYYGRHPPIHSSLVSKSTKIGKLCNIWRRGKRGISTPTRACSRYHANGVESLALYRPDWAIIYVFTNIINCTRLFPGVIGRNSEGSFLRIVEQNGHNRTSNRSIIIELLN